MRRLCLKNIYIDDSENDLVPSIKCKDCGREIGFIYFENKEWKVSLYFGFKKYKSKIMRWVYEHTKNRDHLGYTYEREWEDMLHNIKQWREDGVLLIGCEEWDEECEENCQGGEPNGAGEENEDGLGNNPIV